MPYKYKWQPIAMY